MFLLLVGIYIHIMYILVLGFQLIIYPPVLKFEISDIISLIMRVQSTYLKTILQH